MIIKKWNFILLALKISVLIFCFENVSFCKRKKEKISENIKAYLQEAHGIEITTYEAMSVIFINNYVCQQCSEELISEIINQLRSDDSSNYIIHFSKFDNSRELFNEFKKVRLIESDEILLYRFGLVFNSHLFLKFKNGKLVKISHFNEIDYKIIND